MAASVGDLGPRTSLNGGWPSFRLASLSPGRKGIPGLKFIRLLLWGITQDWDLFWETCRTPALVAAALLLDEALDASLPDLSKDGLISLDLFE